jgi:hypothetical protein
MTAVAETEVTSIQTCPCSFYDRDPETHDRLQSIETLDPLYAAQLVVMLILDEDMFTGAEEGLFSDEDDFGRFVMAHNWDSPHAMAELADYVTGAAARTRLGLKVQQDRSPGVRPSHTLTSYRRRWVEWYGMGAFGLSFRV